MILIAEIIKIKSSEEKTSGSGSRFNGRIIILWSWGGDF